MTIKPFIEALRLVTLAHPRRCTHTRMMPQAGQSIDDMPDAAAHRGCGDHWALVKYTAEQRAIRWMTATGERCTPVTAVCHFLLGAEGPALLLRAPVEELQFTRRMGLSDDLVGKILDAGNGLVLVPECREIRAAMLAATGLSE